MIVGNRGYKVPNYVIATFEDKFEVSTTDEGFDEVLYGRDVTDNIANFMRFDDTKDLINSFNRLGLHITDIDDTRLSEFTEHVNFLLT